MDLDNVCTVRNRNEYSTKQVQTYHFELTMSPLYPVKLKIAQKQPTAYCSTFCWTDRSRLSQKVIQCSFIFLYVRHFFSSLLTINLYFSLFFIKKFIFKVNMVNFNMWTKFKLSSVATCQSYDLIKLSSK